MHGPWTLSASRKPAAAPTSAAARITPKDKHEKVFTCLKIVNLLYVGKEKPVVNVGFVYLLAGTGSEAAEGC